MKQLYLASILAMAGGLFYYNCCHAQNKISTYQYWFDNNYTTNTLVDLTPKENQYVAASLPLDEITSGLHVFTIRFKDTNGNWSIPDSYYFYKPTNIAGENTMVAWRWWLNDDFEHAKQTVVATPAKVLYLDDDLDLTGLNSGEHTVHFQFKDAAGNWSVVTSDAFTYVKTGTEQNTIAKTIKMYPNPSTETVYFEFGKVLPFVLISVIDSNGRKIQEETYVDTNTAEMRLLFPTNGMYIIKINSGNETASYRLVKN